MDYLPDKPMTCYQAQLTMALHMKDDSGLTTKRRQVFEAHLCSCPKCAQDYEETKWVMGLVKEYWPEKPENKAILEKAKQPVKPRMTVEEGLQDLLRRCPDLAEGLKRQKRMRFIRRIGAVAACLILALSAWLTFSIHSEPDQKLQISEPPAPQQIVSVPKPTIKIELVSGTNKVVVLANQKISTSTNEQKTLIINDKHRMVVNANTILSIEPLAQNDHVGCMVELASGEIFTHVEHDGNPFIVGTPHGQVVITGTTFDIKVTDSSTILVVSEGIVRFESDEGSVNVTAGQLSEIAANSVPTMPTACNSAELTAWANEGEIKEELAHVDKNVIDEIGLDLRLLFPTVALESIDYENWVEKNRDWFQRQFPWIFQLKNALAKEGIEVDYPDLLTKTGDAWQFVCLDKIPVRFSVISSDSLLKTASGYGFDKQWLLENVPLAKTALEKSISSENNVAGLKAFQRWLKYAKEKKPPIPIYSFRASKYLAETRSLIWFAVRAGQYDLTDEERSEVLALLQEEVTAACECRNDDLYPEGELKSSCDDICQEHVDCVVGYIETMKTAEEEIAEYEIGR